MTAPTALIGHTGFVGGNLLRQRPFDELYNSRNIESLHGRELSLLVCSGAPAEKWKANADPEGDRAALGRLTTALAGVRAERVVLISTVDVYPSPRGVDEHTPIDATSAQPYGRHRYELEQFIRDRFPTLVVRLPGLFGTGLKKNIIFDFLHQNQVDRINSESVFQFYGLYELWPDIERAMAAGLELVNFATEPVSVREVAEAGFGLDFRNVPPGATPVRYDVRSAHAGLYGSHDGYLRDRAAVLAGVRRFVDESRVTA